MFSDLSAIITKAPVRNGSFCLLLLFNNAVNVAVEFHFWVAFVFAHFLVYQSAEKDYVGKDIKPEHQNDYGSKGTIDRGIFYRRTYEPGEKSAYNSENKRTEDRARKNFHFIGTAPCVAVINGIKHSGGNYIKNYKSEPVPEVRKIKKIYKIYHGKKRFKKSYKPSSCDNRYCKNVNGQKESHGIKSPPDCEPE